MEEREELGEDPVEAPPPRADEALSPQLVRMPSPDLDDPDLPDLDEVPSFLEDRIDEDDPPPDDPSRAGSDSLEALILQVQIGGGDEEGSFASVQAELQAELRAEPRTETQDQEFPESAGEEEDAPSFQGEAEPEPRDRARDGVRDEDEDPEISAGPCPDILAAIAERQAYIHRLAADRDTFGWVEDPGDAEALRLLQGLRRCEAFPEDPDCKAPPIEVRLQDLEPPRHQYERWPSDLSLEGKEPDQILHDPILLDLQHRLDRCLRQGIHQPLLAPGASSP